MSNGPSMHFRQGISLIQLFKLFPDDATAEQWFIKARWPNGIACPRCGSVRVNTKTAHKTMELPRFGGEIRACVSSL